MNGRTSAWFRGTQVRHEGRIRAGGVEKDVTFLAAEPSLNDQIDAEYRTKYRHYPAQYVNHGLDDVARELRLSARTLQPRLLEEELTFHNLVEEARREMAKHYLLQSSLELNETAYLLGYEDPNSFIRAFYKWEGSSPGEWRSARRPQITA